MDYTILAMVLVCVTTAVALGIELYKPAEDGRPPYPIRPRFGGVVLPAKTPRGIVVEFSDGRAMTLPSTVEQLTVFEKLLGRDADQSAYA